MYDRILIKKIKIWLNLPQKYKKNEIELNSQYGIIIILYKNNMMIIKSIYIYPEYRGQKIWTNLVIELEKLNIIIKLQSILNQKLFKFMINRGWKKVDNELSVYFIKTVENG
jgi:GNAT superfamily N-acetyltransferase